MIFLHFFRVASSAKTLSKLPWSWKSKWYVVNITVRLFDNQSIFLYLETYATSESTSDKISQKSCDKYRKISACIIPHWAKFPHSPIHHYTSIYGALFFSVSPVRCTCIIKYGAVRKFFPVLSETVSVSEVNFSCNHCFLKDQLTVCTMKLVTWSIAESIRMISGPRNSKNSVWQHFNKAYETMRKVT